MPRPALRHRLTIEWSDEDNAYLFSLPELYGEGRFATHGATYEEALKNGLEVMEMLVESIAAEGRSLPEPAVVSREPVG